MAEFDAERLRLAEQTRLSIASVNRLTPRQARSFVRGLQTSWQVPSIAWAEGESEDQLNDARKLLHAADIFLELEGEESLKAKDCFRRAAELLEWLSRADDRLRDLAPIELMAAAAFQLGGFPAMALGLLNQIDIDYPGVILYSKFLKADFDGVLLEITSFWQAHPNLTERNDFTNMLGINGQDGMEWYFTVELVRSLGLIASTLRQGDDARLAIGIQKLNALEKMAIRTFSEDISLLISLLSSVADGYRRASIYHPVLQLALLKPAKTPRLLRFARDQFFRGRGVLWSSQLHGLTRLIEASSFALCTPTGSGKTLVANLGLVKELLLAPDDITAPLALYIVPSRALAGEVEAKLTSELGNDLIVTGLYGGADWGITDYWLNAERPTVLIATVEKADAIMRYVGPLIISRLRLLIVDEAHQVVTEYSSHALTDFAEHSSRSLRLESFVSRLLTQAPNIARIALTAVAEGAAVPVARWIEGSNDAQPIGTNYRSTRQIIGTLSSTPERSGQISVDMINGSLLYVRGRGERVYIPLQTPAMPQLPSGMRNSIFKYNQINVLWTALHLVDDEKRVLISVAQEPEKVMKWYKQALELPTWQGVSTFTPPTDILLLRCYQDALATCLDYCGENSYELELLRYGIATSHGQMPQRLRRLMTALIVKRICPITIATATLTEGVNLPFDIIFVTSLKRRSFDNETSQQIEIPISTSEFRNLAGRAGRPGETKGLEGLTLIAIPTAPSTTAAGSLSMQKRQINTMRADYESLVNALLEDEQANNNVASPLAMLLHTIENKFRLLYGLSAEEFLQWMDQISPLEVSENAGLAVNEPFARLADSLDELDGVLLTAIEEVSSSKLAELNRIDLEAFLANLWQSTFSVVAAHQEAWLESAFVRRGHAIISTVYTDEAERKRLFQYGFTPHVGRRFEMVAPSIKELIQSADGYYEKNTTEKLDFFRKVGDFLTDNRGFGFRTRNTQTDINLLENWHNLLSWWMSDPESDMPEPEELRAWQRFVTDNIEFRLGVAMGAVVAQAWSSGADNPLTIPSLSEWRQTTGLPWFGFWARELLRWGTLEPFVAFALSQGRAGTRSEAENLYPGFQAWMQSEKVITEADDWIDPQNYLAWLHSTDVDPGEIRDVKSYAAELTGTDGRNGEYKVIPLNRDGAVYWIDASGFELARSNHLEDHQDSPKNDYLLSNRRNNWTVRKVF